MTSRFFPPAEPQQLGKLADAVGARVDEAARARIVSDVMPLDTAEPDHVSFLRDAKHKPALSATRAGAVFVDPRHADAVPEGTVPLLTPHPGNAFGLAAALFHPYAMTPRPFTTRTGGEIAQTAVIEDPDGLEANVIVEANAVIARGVEIGRGTVIGPNVVIGPGCTIGRNTFIGANSTIQCAHIGDRVIIHPGVRIGQGRSALARTRETATARFRSGRPRCVHRQDDVEIVAPTPRRPRLAARDHTVILARAPQIGQPRPDRPQLGDRACHLPSSPGWPGSPAP